MSDVAKEVVEEVGHTVQSGFRYNPQYFALVIIVVLVFAYLGFIQYLKDQNDTKNMINQNQVLRDGFKTIDDDLKLIHEDNQKIIIMLKYGKRPQLNED